MSSNSGKRSADSDNLRNSPKRTKKAVNSPLSAFPSLVNAVVDFNRRDRDGFTALMLFSLNGRSDLVQQLIDLRVDIDAQRDDDGSSALHYAAWSGHVDVAAALLTAGASRSLRNKDECTALMAAARYGQVEVLKLFLSRSDRDLSFSTRTGENALTLAILHEQTEAVKVLLEAGALRYPQPSPLHKSISVGSVEITRLLIEAKAYINHEGDGEQRMTPLIQAVLVGNATIVRLLLDNGADTDAWDDDELQAIHHAVDAGDQQMLKLLLAAGADPNGGLWTTPLMSSIDIGNIQAAKVLINAGADLNPTQPGGTGTALMMAAKEGQLKFVNLLLAAKAEVNICDHYGNTALMWAVREQHLGVVKALVAARADLNRCFLDNPEICETSPAIAKLLLASQANVNIRDEYGNTLLMRAVESSHINSVKMLLKHRVNVNERNYAGQNALMVATREEASYIGHKKLVNMLIDAKAEIIPTKSTENPYNRLLFEAVKNIDVDTIEELLNAGADVDATDPKTSDTALMLAVRADDKDVVDLLISRKANVNLRNRTGNSILGQAAGVCHICFNPAEKQEADRKQEALVQSLIDANAQFDPHNHPRDANFFLYSCKDKDTSAKMIELLVSAKADINPKPYISHMPLTKAVNNPDKVKVLLQAGANVDAHDKDGETALMAAIRAQNLESVKLLLQAKADVHVMSLQRMTALSFAVNMNMVDAVSLLLAAGASVQVGMFKYNSPVISAVRLTNIPMLQFLIDARANVNVTAFGVTPLAIAAYYNEIDAVKILLNSGANPNHRNTAVDVLAAVQHCGDKDTTQLMKLLVAAKADVNSRNHFNPSITPLLREISSNTTHIRNVQLLINAGAELEVCDSEGRTALMLAACVGKTKTLQHFLNAFIHSLSGECPGSSDLVCAQDWFEETPQDGNERQNAVFDAEVHHCWDIFSNFDPDDPWV